MAIDNCAHSFEELTASVLPSHFKRLQAAIQSPIAAETLVGHKSLTKKLLSRLSRTTDFPGCYVFMDEKKPIYVGISRGVINRLVQHLNHDSHYSASLIYRMASGDYPHEMKRDQAMKDVKFRTVFLSGTNTLEANEGCICGNQQRP
jgi:hypothetical protein